MSKYKIYDEDINKMINQGKRISEISLVLNIDARRVSERVKALQINPVAKSNVNLEVSIKTQEQRDILLGAILGDGCIFKGKKNINYRMNLAHSLNQKEYFEMKFNVLKDLGFNDPKIETQKHSKSGKVYSCIKTQSLSNVLFTKMYDKWYSNGKKTISIDFVNEINPRVLAIIFFDDGFKANTSLAISMCNFDLQSINNLRSYLLTRFKIDTTVTAKKDLYIRKCSRDVFIDLIKDYATSDVLYKLC